MRKIEECRDEKDNFILEAAIEGKADFIVTGDKDLLVLDPFETIPIITYKQFESILERLDPSNK